MNWFILAPKAEISPAVIFRGTVKWRFQAKRAITASPLVDHGVVYVPSVDGYCYALDAKSGWVIWRFRMDKGSISSPIKVDNNLYFGSADGNLVLLGSRKWHAKFGVFRTEHQIAGSAAIYKDVVYTGSVDGNLYAVDISNGRLRWKFKTNKPIIGSPIVYNDIVYVGSTDFTVYALLA